MEHMHSVKMFMFYLSCITISNVSSVNSNCYHPPSLGKFSKLPKPATKATFLVKPQKGQVSLGSLILINFALFRNLQDLNH